jgi:hypothetical protein
MIKKDLRLWSLLCSRCDEFVKVPDELSGLVKRLLRLKQELTSLSTSAEGLAETLAEDLAAGLWLRGRLGS